MVLREHMDSFLILKWVHMTAPIRAACTLLYLIWGSLKRSARAVQLLGRVAALETHTLRY